MGQVLIDVITTPAHDGPSRRFGVHRTGLGPKEAEVRMTGCDLHARQQRLAMLDNTTGEVATLKHEGNTCENFMSTFHGRRVGDRIHAVVL
jgi:hypothetical protein